jgi:hypothetical protein
LGREREESSWLIYSVSPHRELMVQTHPLELLVQVWNPQWGPLGKADAMSVAVNVMGLDAASRSRARLRLQEFTRSLPGIRTAAVTWLG